MSAHKLWVKQMKKKELDLSKIDEELYESIKEKLLEDDEVTKELREELKEDLEDDVREDLRNDFEDEIKDELREEFEEEIKDKLKEDLEDDVRQELGDDWTEEKQMNRIGIENIRQSRLKRLLQEKETWENTFSAAKQIVPNLSCLLMVTIVNE